MEQLSVSSGNRYGGKPENQADASVPSQTLFSAGVITMHLVADRFFHSARSARAGTGSLAGIKTVFLFWERRMSRPHYSLYRQEFFGIIKDHKLRYVYLRYA